jgi:ataxin-3
MFAESIFHEKQEGQLCAQHCINNLLQETYYTPTDLSSIAQQLDTLELDTLIQGDPQNEDILRKEFKSNNYDDSGFFSLQVVQKALLIFNLELININSSDGIAIHAKQNPEESDAFICNLDEHWFTLRRFGKSVDRWYNLNSVFKEPLYVTQTYLGMLLQQLETEGYSIFVVSGEIPISRADEEAFVNPKPGKEELEKKQEDDDLQKAIKMSMGSEEIDDDLEMALKASMMDAGVDEESMRLAIAASLSEPPLPNDSKRESTTTQEDLDEIRRKRLERFK